MKPTLQRPRPCRPVTWQMWGKWDELLVRPAGSGWESEKPALQVCQGEPTAESANTHPSALFVFRERSQAVLMSVYGHCVWVYEGSPNGHIQISSPYGCFYGLDISDLIVPLLCVSVCPHYIALFSLPYQSYTIAVWWQLLGFFTLSGAAVSVTSDWVRK